jgi:hypothetical protein
LFFKRYVYVERLRCGSVAGHVEDLLVDAAQLMHVIDVSPALVLHITPTIRLIFRGTRGEAHSALQSNENTKQ